MHCPICKTPVQTPSAVEGKRNWFPFCGERCKMIDLGRWLGEKYQIPVEISPDEKPWSGTTRNRTSGEASE
ncbi:MAG: DNA gyrase inhibitor YacG [Phycisphaerales bacterium]|nr:DNA gyrase inhibitor YacG [Phycisphaerales bacterium]